MLLLLLQVLYAARDALVTLHCYRRLRLWHHARVTVAVSGEGCQVQLTKLRSHRHMTACHQDSWIGSVI